MNVKRGCLLKPAATQSASPYDVRVSALQPRDQPPKGSSQRPFVTSRLPLFEHRHDGPLDPIGELPSDSVTVGLL
jgi:hypothetical protein